MKDMYLDKCEKCKCKLQQIDSYDFGYKHPIFYCRVCDMFSVSIGNVLITSETEDIKNNDLQNN